MNDKIQGGSCDLRMHHSFDESGLYSTLQLGIATELVVPGDGNALVIDP